VFNKASGRTNGVNAMKLPVRDLESNWTYMVWLYIVEDDPGKALEIIAFLSFLTKSLDSAKRVS
jgi:hypothetical protein